MAFDNTHDATLCDVCGERPATMSLTFVTGGERRESSLDEIVVFEALDEPQVHAIARRIGERLREERDVELQQNEQGAIALQLSAPVAA